jgi:hypothetical protein
VDQDFAISKVATVVPGMGCARPKHTLFLRESR